MPTNIDLLIEKINGLQDICNKNNVYHNLDLPQIAVIGSQSSGKSSVLENIVGRDFLPRGTGIVTRRPLILQLIYSREEDYVVFNHTEKVFTDFNEVKKEIMEETSRSIKGRNDVSQVPITLKFYSRNVLTLTLIDLPGLVRVPTNDQPKNICTKIVEMCKKYVFNKNALILAVSAANTDISNSDALQLAREVDPNYERTIGVLTKVDLMDEGTNIVDVLAGRIIALKLGFVPVINRSQSDIERNKNIRQALNDEKQFFAKHEAYMKNKAYCGTSYLIQKLHIILHEHIKLCLPSLQERITLLLIETQNRLEELGCINLSPKESVMKIINDISRKFNDTLRGNFEAKTNELIGGARINYTFNNHFSGFMDKLSALDDISDDQIRAMLYNTSGSSSITVFSHSAFEGLAKLSIRSLKPHSLKLVNLVLSELVKMAHQVIGTQRFSALNDRIIMSLVELFKRRCDETYKLVGAFIDWNVGYISTRHPDFIKWDQTLSKEIENFGEKAERSEVYKNMEKKSALDSLPTVLRIKGAMSSQENLEIGLMKSMVKSYFNIVKKIIVDQVPKAIMNELVYKSEAAIQETLFKEVYDKEDLETMVSETSEMKEKRKQLEDTLEALRQAYDLICSL